MESILKKITELKRKEVRAKYETGVYRLYEEATGDMAYTPVSMKEALKKSPSGIIAEFKRRSPSRHDIHPAADPIEIIAGYESAGAAACSILTDTPFFGGSLGDLAMARTACRLPLLRKEFIIDPCQITEARVFGADAILLIAAILSASEIESLTDNAHDLGLEVLLEIHNEKEIEKVNPKIDMIGVNNRDLSTFNVDISTSRRHFPLLPPDAVKVSESGIHTAAEIKELRKIGFRGFLLGQAFMENNNPPIALKDFLKQF